MNITPITTTIIHIQSFLDNGVTKEYLSRYPLINSIRELSEYNICCTSKRVYPPLYQNASRLKVFAKSNSKMEGIKCKIFQVRHWIPKTKPMIYIKSSGPV